MSNPIPQQLVPDKVLIYYNGPCLFVCGLFLAVLVDDNTNTLKYLVTEVTPTVLADVEGSRMTLRDAFLSGPMHFVNVDGDMTVLSVEATSPELVGEDRLPIEGVYLY